MADKICLVTGATSGVGRAVAGGLAASGAHVVALVRDASRGRVLAEWMRRRIEDAVVEPLIADLSDLGSIRRAAATFRTTHSSV